MYREIRDHPTVVTRYAERLEKEGVIDGARIKAMRDEIKSTLEDALSYARDFMPRQQVFALGGVWKGFQWAGSDWSADTRVPVDRLVAAAQALQRLPDDFTPHPRLKKLLDQRLAMIESGKGIDWGCARNARLSSLLLEKMPVRLTGQDTGRGTFSHRHAMLYDHENGAELRAARSHFARRRRPGRDRGRQQSAQRGRGARLRVRDVERRPPPAGDLGGAVRRLRQRSAGDHRSVHLQRRVEVAAHERLSCCCCRTATRARGRSTRARAWSASCSSRPTRTCRW